MQRKLKMSRIYSLAEILSQIFVKKKKKKKKKTKENWDLIYAHGLTN